MKRHPLSVLLFSLACATVLAPTASADDLTPLDIPLPKPVLKGTPPPPPEARIDPSAPARFRAPFLAPAGSSNLALDAVVTSQTPPGLGALDWLIDDDKETTEGSVVELNAGPQWIQLDLGATHELDAIVFWHFHGMPIVFRDAIVQVSENPDFLSGVTVLFNNDHDNTSGQGLGTDYEYVETNEGRLVDAQRTRARYVRTWTNGSSASKINQWIEISIFGRPVSP